MTQAFESLATERQLELLGELAVGALPHWGLDGSRLDLMKHRENTVYRVTSPAGERFAMRVHRLGYHTDEELDSELLWLESLRSAGVATTVARHTLEDARFVTVRTEALPEGRQCDLLQWVPGEAIGSVEAGVSLDERTLVEVYRRAGELAARIHNHGESWRPPAGFVRMSWDEDGFFGETGSICGRYWDLEILTAEQLALLHRARDVTAEGLRAFGKSPDRYGMVHGDLLPENLFYDGAELRLIDWDDTGFGWHMYDFATAMIAHLDRPSFEVALPAMVGGYRTHRPLPEEHLEMLPILVMARALSYVGWAHTRRATGAALAPMIVASACAFAEELLSKGG